MAGMNGLDRQLHRHLVDGMSPPIGPGNVAGCGFGGGRLSCPANSANGLTITRTVAVLRRPERGAAGLRRAAHGRIEVAATLQGDVTRGPWTATISRTRNFVHTGLPGTETSRTTNGTATGAASRSRMQ